MRQVMKRRLVIFIITFLTAIGFCFILSSCGNNNTATIEKIDGASVNGYEIFMYVDSTTNEVTLSDKVKCSNKSIWKLYYDSLGQTEIPTKIATGKNGKLQDGDNIFYIVVNSQDGTNSNTYQLTIHKSYTVNIYYHSGESVLKTESTFTGVEYSVDYVPNLEGYNFNGWETINGEIISKFTPWQPTHLYADITPLNFDATLDVNGGDTLENTNISLTYGESATLPVPTRTGYTFVGWYIGNTALTDNTGKTLSDWKASVSSTIIAHWEIIHLSVDITRNDLEAGTVTGSGQYDYGTEITLVSTTNAGYNFIGWFDSNDTLISEDSSYSFNIIENISVFAKWNYFTLTSSVSNFAAGNATIYTDKKVSVGDKVELVAVDYGNFGYTWKGWYANDTLLTEKLTFTYTMTSTDVIIVALWEKYDELKNFTFTSNSTSETCSITGIIDKSIDSIFVPDYVSSIAIGAFSGCTNLVSVSLPFVGKNNNATQASEETLLGIIFGLKDFSGAAKITQVYTSYSLAKTYYIPSRLKTVEIRGGYIFYGALSNCTMLTHVVFSERVMFMEEAALQGCNNLTTVSVPFIGKSSNSNNSCEALFGYIFGRQNYNGSVSARQWYGTMSNQSETYYLPITLTKVIVTATKKIPYGAFSYCSTIKEIVLPETLTEINSAFGGCTNLESIYYNDIDEHWSQISGVNNINLGSVNLYFYSEKYPYSDGVTSGNFWHYVDSEIIIWVKED